MNTVFVIMSFLTVAYFSYTESFKRIVIVWYFLVHSYRNMEPTLAYSERLFSKLTMHSPDSDSNAL